MTIRKFTIFYVWRSVDDLIAFFTDENVNFFFAVKTINLNFNYVIIDRWSSIKIRRSWVIFKFFFFADQIKRQVAKIAQKTSVGTQQNLSSLQQSRGNEKRCR